MRSPLAWSSVLACMLIAAPARAQPPAVGPGGGLGGPVARPPFSPYLNLLRGNTNPALNYYGLVRPQLQNQAAIQSLQTQLLYPTNPVPGLPNEQALVTGNAVGFQNHRGYFQNQYAGGSFGAAGNRSGVSPLGLGGTSGAGMNRSPATGPQPPRR